MRKLVTLLVLLSFAALAEQTALRDNFTEVESVGDNLIVDTAKSVATMVQAKNIIPVVNEQKLEEFATLASMPATKKNLRKMKEISDSALVHILNLVAPKDAGMCKGFEYKDQPFLSNCTGSLVAPDLILTAGHCVKIKNFCKRFKWVFDYKYESTAENFAGVNPTRSSEQIYSCKKVVRKVHSKIPIYGALFRSDVALVKLDKRVVGRQPLELDFEYKPKKDDEIFLISNPRGLPQKYSEGKIEQRVTKAITMAKLAALGGSSGGPIFSKESGKIIGVLVRGPLMFREKTEDEKKCEYFDYTTVEEGFTSGISPLRKIEKAYNRYIFKN